MLRDEVWASVQCVCVCVFLIINAVDGVWFQNASCSSHRSSSFSEVSLLCFIPLIQLRWSGLSNACVTFTDGVSEEHQSWSEILRCVAELLQSQRDWSESSDDGHQSPDECEALLVLHMSWCHTSTLALFSTNRTHIITNSTVIIFLVLNF